VAIVVMFLCDHYSIPIVFEMCSILLLISSIYAAKRAFFKLNRISMENDLNCWLLRLISGVIVLIGVLIGAVGFTLVSLNLNLWWLSLSAVGIEVMLIGVFSAFRFHRRYGKFIYIR